MRGPNYNLPNDLYFYRVIVQNIIMKGFRVLSNVIAQYLINTIKFIYNWENSLKYPFSFKERTLNETKSSHCFRTDKKQKPLAISHV